LIEQLIQQAQELAEDEPDDALRIISNILNDEPNEPRALFIAGYIFMHAERYGLAYAMNKRCAELASKREEVWNNLGMCCMKMNKIDEARKHFNHSLQINRINYPALNNLALIEVNEAKPRKAIELCHQSLKINPDQWDVRETLGYANLMLGNWEAGWDGYEAMVGNTPQRTVTPRQDVPYWDGSDVKLLHVRGEQGIGDEISFASILHDVKPDVLLECDKRLEGLFKRSFPDLRVQGTRFDKNAVLSDSVDAWCLIGSLGWHYRTKDSEFSGKPYLKADPERKLQWRALLDSLGSKPKIGIAWTGGLKDTHEERRSLELEALLPILKQDATFISLQYKNPQKELDAFEQKHSIHIHHWARATESSDYDDTAALVDELDLVVSVQTAVVHLCAGLGKKCLVLVPNKPHWRYGQDRYMWGDSVELFRQDRTWAEAIKEINDALQQRISRDSKESAQES
jgi:tetratricopeptide (TPR) repeat protein